MTPERKNQMDKLGAMWEKSSVWEHKWKLTAQYKQQNGNLDIPAQHKTSDGIWLGRWLYEQKLAELGIA